jgi:predicted PurR-regulated permease PerM
VIIDKDLKLPFYLKATIFLVGIFALITILYIAQSILVPLVFAIIIAITLHPLVNYLVDKKVNRVLAITLALVLTFLVIAAFATLLISQASRFSETWPALVEKFTGFFNQTINWISQYFDIKHYKIVEWITKTRGELINTSGAAIEQTIVSIGNLLMVLVLIPVYVFMILFYHPILLSFIHKIFVSSNQEQLGEVITQTKTVIQRYLVGLVIEAIIVATLDAGALLILGIDYAILLGILAALLNVIPYIGGVVAVAMPMMVAIATKSSAWYAIWVLIAYYIIQLIDNHYIIPKIVASKVKINALFAIIIVLAGNALWGIPGMFLSIPMLAIVKLIFDHIEPLKPWGFLLGDTMPSLLKIKLPFIKTKPK